MIDEKIDLILQDVKKKFKINFHEVEPMPFGFMNKLYHLKGDTDYILKIYSKERFSPKKMDHIKELRYFIVTYLIKG